ncbi:MAG: hypothetical protein UU02_C0044G0014 [Candidatus Woesebacteria bacterium GW2011_GWA1_40_43]|uniref:Uncharacterized protein n=1 Tax=Candidatus Woesebacteria bacterium GW2011_GWA1_40_43 TaxID=1618553 RepID=A0A0G0USD1_9BACT|nr:MAG: hypothetical protein UU02_C0044G0014 [Candidatus Woesebacteria bacterium GW2011_GWA1_40_43]
MEEKIKKEVKVVNKYSGGGAGGAVYGLGFIGALVYFIQHSTTFVDGHRLAGFVGL